MKTTLNIQTTMVLILTTIVAGTAQAQKSFVVPKTAPVENFVAAKDKGSSAPLKYSQNVGPSKAQGKSFGEVGKMSPAARLQKSSTPQGGMSSSGGHGAEECGGELLDTCENKGTRDFNPLAVGRVEEILQDLEAKIPAFYKKIIVSLEKNWYLEPKAMDQCKGGESVLRVNLITAACQNNVDVRINQKWFQTTGKTPQGIQANQEATIIHELVRSLYLEEGETDPKMEMGLRNIVRHIINKSPASVLRMQIANSNFGGYFTTEDLSVYRRITANLKQMRERATRGDTSLSSEEVFSETKKIANALESQFDRFSPIGDGNPSFCITYYNVADYINSEIRLPTQYKGLGRYNLVDYCERTFEAAVYGNPHPELAR